MRWTPRLCARLLAGLMVLSPLNGPLFAASELPELGDVAATEFSLLTEKKIGRQIMQEIRWRDPSYLDDPEVEVYLNQLGNKLVLASNDPGSGFYFFPIDDRMINAFALPGGFIGVNTGLLLAAQSESEVAGVLAHEVSHVTQRHISRQIFKEKQMAVPALLAMAAAMLAARTNPQMASAAAAVGQGSVIQAQLGFSRDNEREADRVGFDTLQKAGFDVRGMSVFFERLQRATRTYENNAPVYLRSHPLTTERISDMQNREQRINYRQVPDSFDFALVRAKLRAMRDRAVDAVKDYEALLKEKKYASEPATRYGMAVAYVRAKNWEGAQRELALVRKAGRTSPMVDRLAADVRIGQGDVAGGLADYRDALKRAPLNIALIYAYGDALVAAERFADAYSFAEQQVQDYPQDVRLFLLLARSAAETGRQTQKFRATGEAYALQGQTVAAIEQFQFAQKAGDANFYELSVIDARLRELKRRRDEEMKEKRQP